MISYRKIVFKGKDSDSFISFFLCNLITRAESISLLCKSGYGKSGLIILRSVFEDFIHFKWLLQHKDKSEDFFYYAAFSKLKLARDQLDGDLDDKLKSETEEKIKKLEEEWDLVKDRFSNPRTDWTGKNLKEMSAEVGMLSYYLTLYKIACKHAHIDPVVVWDMLIGIDSQKGIAVMKIGVSLEFIKNVLVSTIELLLITAADLEQEYKFGLDSEVQSKREHLGKLNKHYKKL